MHKAKAPKTLADNLTWIHGAIMEFGIAGLQVRELIEFLKFALSSSNAAVRTNSVTVLGALRIFVGPGKKRKFRFTVVNLICDIIINNLINL